MQHTFLVAKVFCYIKSVFFGIKITDVVHIVKKMETMCMLFVLFRWLDLECIHRLPVSSLTGSGKLSDEG